MSAFCRPIYVDLTTAFEERHRIPHGTTRVERKLIEALVGLGNEEMSFCRFDPRTRYFVGMSKEEALVVATTVPVADAKRQPRLSSRRNPIIAELYKVEVWVRRHIRDRFRRIRGTVARVTKPTIDFFEPGSVLFLPGELQRHDFATLMDLRRRLGVKIVFLFYDLLDTLSNDDPRAHDANAVNIPGSEFVLREASLVLPISKYSEGELRKHAAKRNMLPPIQTIRLGHQIAKAPSVSAVAGLMPDEFVLTVGDVTPRKNHQLLVEIWASLARDRSNPPLPLVIAGRVGVTGQSLVAASAANPGTSASVKFFSDIGDAQLTWLYRNCRFTLFPSFSEGFGLPVVESLAFGKPCIASSAASIPEASQGAAIHLDPKDKHAWQQAVRTMLDDDQALAVAKQNIAKGFRVTSWTETATEVVEAIDRHVQRESPASRSHA